jgi:hypothetical protein
LVSMVMVVLGIGAALCWVMWLYLTQYKRLRSLETDNYRLIRALGRYHGVALGTTGEHLVAEPDTSPIPPFFRMKRPTKPAIRAGSKEL